LDDIAHQVAGDASSAITRRLATFRGESRFTTWACKFVMLEVSAKLGQHFWTRPGALALEQWEQLPARLGAAPDSACEASRLLAAVQSAVDTLLSPYQRDVFVALLVHGIPADALAMRLATNRNALYTAMFEARRTIRASLVTKGYLADSKDIRR
jgi:RNA polymerase sigma-70 factor (ECF subfamily)